MEPLIRFLQHFARLRAEPSVLLQMPHEGHGVGHVEHYDTFSARRLSASDNSWLAWRKSSSVRFSGVSFQSPSNRTICVGHCCSSSPQSFRLISLIFSSVWVCFLPLRRNGLRFPGSGARTTGSKLTRT